MEPFDKLNIILIDDYPAVDSIKKGLAKIGIQADVVYIEPSESEPNLIREITSEELDNCDVGFIDLELFPDRRIDPFGYNAEDLQGGTVILPTLRKIAPWIPLIAFTRFLDIESVTNNFAYIASSFGFDGHLYRSVFLSQNFSRKTFNTILYNSIVSRIYFCTGTVPDFSNLPDLDCDPKLEESLIKLNNDWQSVLKKFFWFSSKIVIEKATQGFSGSYVLKIYASTSDIGYIESPWIIKLNKSPSKLHKELTAHQNMMRKGIRHARMANLVWPNVFFHNKLAVIGYKFIEDSETLSGKFTSLEEIKAEIDKLGVELDKFYFDRNLDRSNLLNILNHSYAKNYDEIINIYKRNSEYIAPFVDKEDSKDVISVLDKSIIYSRAMIHGDLHLDNIMKGESYYFIDFAHSKIGPIVMDAAKLYTDIILRLPEMREQDLYKLSSKPNALKDNIKKVFKMEKDDSILFELYIINELVNALDYEQLESGVKNWIRRSLKISIS